MDNAQAAFHTRRVAAVLGCENSLRYLVLGTPNRATFVFAQAFRSPVLTQSQINECSNLATTLSLRTGTQAAADRRLRRCAPTGTLIEGARDQGHPVRDAPWWRKLGQRFIGVRDPC